MQQQETWFVRIDTKNNEKLLTDEVYLNHLKYLSQIAPDLNLIGGGFKNTSGGMILFQSMNINEARKVCEADPLILTETYSYELFEWKLKIVANGANC